MVDKEVFISVNINFRKDREIVDIMKFCRNENAVDIINDIKQRYNIEKEIYECIKIEIGCDKGINSFIDFNLHHSQYLSDEAKKEIIEIVRGVEEQLLDKLQTKSSLNRYGSTVEEAALALAQMPNVGIKSKK